MDWACCRHSALAPTGCQFGTAPGAPLRTKCRWPANVSQTSSPCISIPLSGCCRDTDSIFGGTAMPIAAPFAKERAPSGLKVSAACQRIHSIPRLGREKERSCRFLKGRSQRCQALGFKAKSRALRLLRLFSPIFCQGLVSTFRLPLLQTTTLTGGRFH